MSSHVWQTGSVCLYGVWKEQTDFDRPWIEPQCSRASRPRVSESSQVLSPFCGVRYESASIQPLSFTMRALGNMIGCWCIINADGQLTCCRLACDSPERWLGSARVDWGWVRSLLMDPPPRSCWFCPERPISRRFLPILCRIYCKRLVELDHAWVVLACLVTARFL